MKTFKEGSDFEAAAKVLLSEDRDELNESDITSLSNDRTYIIANNTIKEMFVYFDEDGILARKIKNADNIRLFSTPEIEFRKMRIDLENLVRRWIKIVNEVEGNEAGSMPSQFRKYF